MTKYFHYKTEIIIVLYYFIKFIIKHKYFYFKTNKNNILNAKLQFFKRLINNN